MQGMNPDGMQDPCHLEEPMRPPHKQCLTTLLEVAAPSLLTARLLSAQLGWWWLCAGLEWQAGRAASLSSSWHHWPPDWEGVGRATDRLYNSAVLLRTRCPLWEDWWIKAAPPRWPCFMGTDTAGRKRLVSALALPQTWFNRHSNPRASLYSGLSPSRRRLRTEDTETPNSGEDRRQAWDQMSPTLFSSPALTDHRSFDQQIFSEFILCASDMRHIP